MIKLGGLVNLKPINESEDDKYVSIGFGRFKEKGKEDDKDAPTFKKDGDKYVPTKGDTAAKGGDSSAGEEKPKVNIFNKGKEKPKSKKGTSVFDVPGGLDVDDFGGSGALSKHLYGDDEESDVVGKPEGKPASSYFSRFRSPQKTGLIGQLFETPSRCFIVNKANKNTKICSKK